MIFVSDRFFVMPFSAPAIQRKWGLRTFGEGGWNLVRTPVSGFPWNPVEKSLGGGGGSWFLLKRSAAMAQKEDIIYLTHKSLKRLLPRSPNKLKNGPKNDLLSCFSACSCPPFPQAWFNGRLSIQLGAEANPNFRDIFRVSLRTIFSAVDTRTGLAVSTGYLNLFFSWFPVDTPLFFVVCSETNYSKRRGPQHQLRKKKKKTVMFCRIASEPSPEICARGFGTLWREAKGCGKLAQLQTQNEKIVNLTQKRLKRTFCPFSGQKSPKWPRESSFGLFWVTLD